MGNVVIKESYILSSSIAVLSQINRVAVATVDFDCTQATVIVTGDGLTASLKMTEDAANMGFHVHSMGHFTLNLQELRDILQDLVSHKYPVRILSQNQVLQFFPAVPGVHQDIIPQIGYDKENVHVQPILLERRFRAIDSGVKITLPADLFRYIFYHMPNHGTATDIVIQSNRIAFHSHPDGGLPYVIEREVVAKDRRGLMIEGLSKGERVRVRMELHNSAILSAASLLTGDVIMIKHERNLLLRMKVYRLGNLMFVVPVVVL